MDRRNSEHRKKTRPPFEVLDAHPFDWNALVNAEIHELKVAIAEALDWIGEPLSASELWQILDPAKHKFYKVEYHARKLKTLGVTEEAWEREARGATEVYYVANRPTRTGMA